MPWNWSFNNTLLEDRTKLFHYFHQQDELVCYYDMEGLLMNIGVS